MVEAPVFRGLGGRASRRFTGPLIALFTLVMAAGPVAAQTRIGPKQHPSTAKLRASSALDRLVFNRINSIRGTFGLVSGVKTMKYNAEVLRGIRTNLDPPFAPPTGGIVAEETLWGLLPASSAISFSPLDVVNAWVYDDGWEGSAQATWNVDCTSAGAPSCDGHRRAVLSTSPVAGAKLYIDVSTQMVNAYGSPGLAIAALLVWKMSTA